MQSSHVKNFHAQTLTKFIQSYNYVLYICEPFVWLGGLACQCMYLYVEIQPYIDSMRLKFKLFLAV